MTESLSVLDRGQLQKLIQYAIEEEPAGILGKIFKRYGDFHFIVKFEFSILARCVCFSSIHSSFYLSHQN